LRVQIHRSVAVRALGHGSAGLVEVAASLAGLRSACPHLELTSADTLRPAHLAGFFDDLRAASSAAAFSACFSERVRRGFGFSLATWASLVALGLSFACGRCVRTRRSRALGFGCSA